MGVMDLNHVDLKLYRLNDRAGRVQTPEAFTALYERTHLIIFRYIYALHGEPQEDVEDLWLETFLKAWRSRDSFSGNDEAALGWLLHIARNLVIDRHRRKQRNPIIALSDAETIPAPHMDTPESRVLAKEQAQALSKMLEVLPSQQREVVILRYVVGWRVKEIAIHLHRPENTVSVILRRAIARLSQSQE